MKVGDVLAVIATAGEDAAEVKKKAKAGAGAGGGGSDGCCCGCANRGAVGTFQSNHPKAEPQRLMRGGRRT